MVVKLKGMCFLVIALALIMSYQKNPFGTLIVGGIGILVYLLYKSRKRSNGTRRGWIFNKGSSHQRSQMEDLINLLVVHSFLNNSMESEKPQETPKSSKKLSDLEKMKNEILSLFDEV